MRYIILLLLNFPIILLAFINIITQRKLRRTSATRFRFQIVSWILLLVVLVLSFPAYNQLMGRPALDSSELSLFDIVEVTAIIFLFYVVNRQRQTINQVERVLRELHQETSIQLASLKKKL